MTNFTTDPTEIAQNVMNACEEAHSMAASYVNAATKANKAAWQGFNEMLGDVHGMMQESCARAVDTCKTLVTAKSAQEAADTHAEFLKNCFDGLVANGSKISQTSIRTTKEAIEPLSKHANDAMGTMMKKAAHTA